MAIPAFLLDHAGRAEPSAYRQLIDGNLIDGARTVEVVDPALATAFAEAPVADETQVLAAVAAAKRSFPGWSAKSYEERGSVLSRVADAIEGRAEEIARLVVREQGKPLADSRGDVEVAIAFTRYFAGWRPSREVLRDDDSAYIELVRKPIGVVAAILPWNFPFFQAMYKIAPALLTGNTVVCKPSPTTPLNALLLGELLATLVPSGVVNILGDDGLVGPMLTAHPEVAKVSFTGSTVNGKRVMASAADSLKRLTLELGGNDAAIVLADADVAKAASSIFDWAFLNAGQVCINIKRIFVHSSIKEEFDSELAKRAKSIKVGPGLAPETQMGPVQNGKQFDAARRALKLAHEAGTVLAGGQTVDGRGYFVQPTVVTDVDDDNPLVAEETFGPIRTTFAYDDVEEAIKRANATPYGLGNSVWGTDLASAAKVAEQLESGSVWVNQHFAVAPDVPFGGRKRSGMGCEFGLDGLRELTDIQVINVSRT